MEPLKATYTLVAVKTGKEHLLLSYPEFQVHTKGTLSDFLAWVIENGHTLDILTDNSDAAHT